MPAEQDVDGKDIITSFAWHPKEENLLVACRKDGRLAEVHVMERIAPSWSSQHFLVWPQNGTLRSYDKASQFYLEVEDISLRMQHRARTRCFNPTRPFINPNDANLGYHVKLAFAWLDQCKNLMSDLAFKNQFPRQMTVPGIRTAMGLDRGQGSGFVLKSDITYKQWNMGNREVDIKGHRPKRIFKGDARHRTLKLCGWGVDEKELRDFLGSLESTNQCARAAAIAVFNLEIRLALQILERVSQDQENSQDSLHMVGMALAGFSEEKSGVVWREMVRNLLK